MPRYSDDLVNEVFAENDIVDYVSQFVKLKRSGKDYSGLCPFHGEKTPSFHVSQDKQLFHCFGCGASGNLVQFVMKIEGLDFVEALKLLADRAGIILPEDNGVADDIIHEKKQRIYAMNKFSARYFYNNLVKSEAGRTALAYFKDREITPKTITGYGLGFAKDTRNELCEVLKKEGFTENEILEGGLAIEREGKLMDKFRNRVIFPIIDLRGNVIGFGGRIMGQAKEVNGYKLPKYLNSPETLVFNKGRNLFSLNFAKKNNSGSVILVEGYMDVISVYQAGIANIAATLGTAVTADQAKLLLRYFNEILLCYDSDEAGEKATIRAIEIINSVGGKAKVMRLKGAKDPDEYIKKNGVGAFKAVMAEAIPSTEYRISGVKSQFNTDTAEGKIEFIRGAAETLLTVQSEVEIDAYIQKMSKETGISAEAIYAEYRKRKKSNTVQSEQTARRVVQRAERDAVKQDIKPPTKAEKMLLNLMVKDKKHIDAVFEQFKPEDFESEITQKLMQKIAEIRKSGKEPEASLLVNGFSGADATVATDIFFANEVYADDKTALDDLIKDIKKSRITEEISRTTDSLRLKELFEELKHIGRN